MDLLYRKRLLKITQKKVTKWIAGRNERMLIFTLEQGLFAVRMKALEGLITIDYPEVQCLLEKAIDDPVESVSMLAIEELRKSTNDQVTRQKIEKKLRFWERRKKEMKWAASRSRSYPYFDGGNTKESPSSRLMGQLRDQMSNNHPPF